MKCLIPLVLLAANICAGSLVTNHEENVKNGKINNNYGDRIQGGGLVGIKKFPFMISVQDKNQYEKIRGAGIIINKYWGLTAAIHFNPYSRGTVLRAGSSDRDKGKVLTVQKYIKHPEYDGGWISDVALFKFAKPLQFTQTIRPIRIASELPTNGTTATVSGWGDEEWLTERSGTAKLKAAQVQITDSKTCQKYYPGEINEGNYCSLTPNQGPCVYDFGAPLVYKQRAIGVFVGGEGCGSTTKPSLYLDLSKYKHWIEDTIKKNSNPGELDEMDLWLLEH